MCTNCTTIKLKVCPKKNQFHKQYNLVKHKITQRKFPSQEATESESESVGFTSPERQRRQRHDDVGSQRLTFYKTLRQRCFIDDPSKASKELAKAGTIQIRIMRGNQIRKKSDSKHRKRWREQEFFNRRNQIRKKSDLKLRKRWRVWEFFNRGNQIRKKSDSK